MAMISSLKSAFQFGEFVMFGQANGSVSGSCQTTVLKMQLLIYIFLFVISLVVCYIVILIYIYYELTLTFEGMPIQTTTDCGRKTMEIYGFANALQ